MTVAEDVRQRLARRRLLPTLNELSSWSEDGAAPEWKLFVEQMYTWLGAEADRRWLRVGELCLLREECVIDGRASVAEATIHAVQYFLRVMRRLDLWPPRRGSSGLRRSVEAPCMVSARVGGSAHVRAADAMANDLGPLGRVGHGYIVRRSSGGRNNCGSRL